MVAGSITDRHYGPGVDSTSNTKENQKYFLRSKGSLVVGLTSTPSWNLESLTFLDPLGLSRSVERFLCLLYSYFRFTQAFLKSIIAISTNQLLPWGYVVKLLLRPHLLIYAAPLGLSFLLNSGVEISLEDYTCFISPFLVRPTHLTRSLPGVLDWPIRQQENRRQQHEGT